MIYEYSCLVPFSLLIHIWIWLLIFMFLSCYIVFFFFQAEDGIRDYKVTGVQTCALPIYGAPHPHRPWSCTCPVRGPSGPRGSETTAAPSPHPASTVRSGRNRRCRCRR